MLARPVDHSKRAVEPFPPGLFVPGVTHLMTIWRVPAARAEHGRGIDPHAAGAERVQPIRVESQGRRHPAQDQRRPSGARRRSVRFFIAARRPSRCLLYGRRGTACGMLRIAYLHGVEDAVLQQAGPIISPSRNLPFFTRLHSAPWPSQLNNCGSPDIDSTQGVSATCVGTQKCD